MYKLSHMTLKEMTECGVELRRLGAQAASMEEAAERVVRFLYEQLSDDAGEERVCVLTRFYKTHPYGELEPALQEFVRDVMGGEPAPSVKCLTLLASAGDQPEWNDRRSSAGHRAIPLPSEHAVERLPMVAQLIRQLGVPVSSVVQPEPEILLDLQQQTFNVFYVPEAVGSPYIPAQANFVAPFGVKSALGFGGVLPTGDLFAVILFTRVAIARDTADLFKPLALSAKLAVLPFARGPVFAHRSLQPHDVMSDSADQLRAHVSALEQLLDVHEQTTIEQSQRLEQALVVAENAQRLAESQAAELEIQAEELEIQAAHLEEVQLELQLSYEQVQLNAERLRFLADAMPQKVWTADTAGKVNYFNQRWLDYTGMSAAELSDWGWQQILHPDDWPENLRLWQHSIATGTDFELEHRFRRADGAYRWHLSRAVAQRDEHGQVRLWVGTNTDIHEHKEAEAERERLVEQLRVERVRLTRVFAQAPVAICVLRGREHVYDVANPRYLQLIGGREVIGKPVRSALPELEGQGIFELLDEVYRTGNPFIGNEVRVAIDRTGRGELEEVFFNFVYQPLVDASGTVEGIGVVAVEVTDLVRSRVRAEEAQQEAERANRAKSEFLRIMSHELRTPLNAIGGYSELLATHVYGPLSEVQLNAVTRIQRSQLHLLRLINDILNLARIEAGRVDYAIRDVSMAEVVNSVLPLVEPQLAEKDITCSATISPAMSVRADREKLEQILLNLLTNAVKFTPGGGRITVNSGTRAEVPDVVFLTVTDSGIGIPQDKQESIFEPFVQVNASRTGQHGGTGLGLAISRDLARGMGGDLRVRSTENEGSTFTLTLPTTPRPL